MDTASSETHYIIGGEAVTVRSIHSADTGMETEFIRALSPESKHYRFLGGVNELSPGEVSRLCNVDGTQSLAFVATTRHQGQETQIGVSRCAPGGGPEVREFAVTVADAWQRRGLGKLLMEQLIQSARKIGVKRLYCIALWDNAGMRALAGNLGMSASQDPTDPQQVHYSLNL